MSNFQFERPTGRVVMRPAWRHLLFLHWDYDPEAVQKLLPAGLEVDTFEGRAYIGLVPFVMQGLRPALLPNLGALGRTYEDFAELNVRTYVTQNGVRGVWFFSLDAASLLATLAARVWFKLPYFKARMRFSRSENGDFRYFSRRLWPHPKPATCRLRYRIRGETAPANPGTLEQFLVERYVLYSIKNDRIYRGRVHHAPYQIQRAEIETLRQNCIQAAGFSRPAGAPHALYCRGVEVEIWELDEC